jgi:hypothetical protein
MNMAISHNTSTVKPVCKEIPGDPKHSYVYTPEDYPNLLRSTSIYVQLPAVALYGLVFMVLPHVLHTYFPYCY